MHPAAALPTPAVHPIGRKRLSGVRSSDTLVASLRRSNSQVSRFMSVAAFIKKPVKRNIAE